MYRQQDNPTELSATILGMAKRITDSDAPGFGRRLVTLLSESGQPRRGAGAYLARKYRVANVTANAWLNGEYKPNTATARHIAVDHGWTFDALYFGRAGTERPASPEFPAPAIDTDLLEVAVETVELILQELERTGSPKTKADLIVITYEALREGQQRDAVAQLVSRTLRAIGKDAPTTTT
jgi:DNA-binding XRE family transcriptional regulator